MEDYKPELSKAVGTISKFVGTMVGTVVAISKKITSVGTGGVSAARSLFTRHVSDLVTVHRV